LRKNIELNKRYCNSKNDLSYERIMFQKQRFDDQNN